MAHSRVPEQENQGTGSPHRINRATFNLKIGETMSEYVATFKEHDKNWSWFEKHYDELAKKFDGEFVAIYKQNVIDHDKEIGLSLIHI